MAVFDGVELRSEGKAFRGGSMLAWYGGVDADLREATLAPEARLAVTALFGGIQLAFPPSGASSRACGRRRRLRRLRLGSDDPDAPVLRIDGTALFGGIAVSRKRRAVSGRRPRYGRRGG